MVRKLDSERLRKQTNAIVTQTKCRRIKRLRLVRIKPVAHIADYFKSIHMHDFKRY